VQRRFRWLRSPKLVAAVVLLVVIGTYAGWRLFGGPELVPPGDPSAGATEMYPDVAAGQSLSTGVGVVCVRGGAKIRVDRVDLVDAANMVVRSFGLRPSPADGKAGGELAGTELKPLTQRGFPDAGRPVWVGKHCYSGSYAKDPGDGSWELGVEVARTKAGTGSATALLVRYDSAGRERTLEIHYGITLCAYGDPAIPYCQTTRQPKS
jgi:hypothetical protein